MDKRIKHRLSYTKEYRALVNAIARCHNPNHRAYKNYGARGISVCDRWRQNYSLFVHDVGPRPEGKYDLDRINNDGNYEPGNVRWATRSENTRNKRNSRIYNYNGTMMCLTELSELAGISQACMYYRLSNWNDVKRSVETELAPNSEPMRKKNALSRH